MKNRFVQTTEELLEFIQKSPSVFHVIEQIQGMLKEQGFQRVREDRLWKLEPGKGYYVVRSASSLIAFSIPEGECSNFQMIASHSDSPTFKIKEGGEICRDDHYVELNVEKYGGMLMAPWFDRPLSIAGRAIVEKDGMLKTSLVDFARDLVMIPSLAIHMNRQANDGVALKAQTDLLPLLGDACSKDRFGKMLADLLGVEQEQILGTDLFLYDRSRQSIWGASEEYFSSPKLDDLMCAFSSVKAFIRSHQVKNNQKSIKMCCIFDNEEVGSGTKQGADSSFLQDTCERITQSLGLSWEKYQTMISAGFMLSADNAHSVHPNHVAKADPVNHPHMNGGVVIKFHAGQRYTTDAVSAAVFRKICKKAQVPVQVFVNHSDIPGGSTLGNISNSHISLNTIDIGAAQLAMHSPYETAGIKDTWYMIRAMEEFYNTNIAKDEEENYLFEAGTYPKRCACCNQGILEEAHEICEICGWEDDKVQNADPDFAGGANQESLNQARERFFASLESCELRER